MPPSPSSGAGDRWLAGERLPGVRFAQHDEVEVTSGRYAGRRGRVLLLVAMPPEPAYLVALHLTDDASTATDLAVRLRESAIRGVEPA